MTGPQDSLEGLDHVGLGALQLTGLLEDGPGGLEVHAVFGQLADVEAGSGVGLDVGGVSHGGEGDDGRAVLDFDGNDGQLAAHGVWGFGVEYLAIAFTPITHHTLTIVYRGQRNLMCAPACGIRMQVGLGRGGIVPVSGLRLGARASASVCMYNPIGAYNSPYFHNQNTKKEQV